MPASNLVKRSSVENSLSSKFEGNPELHDAMASTIEAAVKGENKAKKWKKVTLLVIFFSALMLLAMFSVGAFARDARGAEPTTTHSHHGHVIALGPRYI